MLKLFTKIIIFVGLTLNYMKGFSTDFPLNSAIDNETVHAIEYLNNNGNIISNITPINKLPDKYTYVAHRGASYITKKPENSLSAFKISKKKGYEIVETDLRLTLDRQWILMHDSTLDRTTNGKGKVLDYSLDDIRMLKLKSSKRNNLSIPTLDEFLALCRKENLIPILDIRLNELQILPRDYNSLLTCIDKYGFMNRSIICSRSKTVLSEIRRRNNTTAIGAMMDISQETLNFVKKLDKALIYCNYEILTDDKIRLMKKNQLDFGVWTINSKDVAQNFLDKGAIIIVTDYLR
jgi:glycerophosphoryl diester phosphodiesterase